MPHRSGRQGADIDVMDADLFSPQDTAALLAIRQAAAERPMSAAELVEAFRVSGLLPAPVAPTA